MKTFVKALILMSICAIGASGNLEAVTAKDVTGFAVSGCVIAGVALGLSKNKTCNNLIDTLIAHKRTIGIAAAIASVIYVIRPDIIFWGYTSTDTWKERLKNLPFKPVLDVCGYFGLKVA